MQDPELLSHLREKSKERPLTRREFMRALTVATAAGPGLISATLSGISLTRSQRAEAAEAIVAAFGKLPKRPVGTRLGHMMVTPVCICYDWNPELFAPALALGINFIHKAGYWGQNIPDVIKRLPRESFYCDITVDNTPDHPDDYDRAYNQVVSSLEQNGLKYYDLFRAHFGWKTVDAYRINNVSYQVFKRLKREGKVRYFGVSQHPYVPYPDIISAEIEGGNIDAMQVWFSYGTAPENEKVFAEASKAGIGMTAMKIFDHGHGRINDQFMQEWNAPGQPGRALLRYTLSRKRPDGKPIFHTCVTALGNLQTFEENIGAVSPQVSQRDGFDIQRIYA